MGRRSACWREAGAGGGRGARAETCIAPAGHFPVFFIVRWSRGRRRSARANPACAPPPPAFFPHSTGTDPEAYPCYPRRLWPYRTARRKGVAVAADQTTPQRDAPRSLGAPPGTPLLATGASLARVSGSGRTGAGGVATPRAGNLAPLADAVQILALTPPLSLFGTHWRCLRKVRQWWLTLGAQPASKAHAHGCLLSDAEPDGRTNKKLRLPGIRQGTAPRTQVVVGSFPLGNAF